MRDEKHFIVRIEQASSDKIVILFSDGFVGLYDISFRFRLLDILIRIHKLSSSEIKKCPKIDLPPEVSATRSWSFSRI